MDERRRVGLLQAVGLLVVGGTMWLLHMGGHSLLVSAVIGLGGYAAVNLAIWRIARRQSGKREERQRRNLEADIDEHRRQLYGEDQ